MNYDDARKKLMSKIAREISDPRVLDAMDLVPRHRFVPESDQEMAYMDIPLPIGQNQTINEWQVEQLVKDGRIYLEMIDAKQSAKAN